MDDYFSTSELVGGVRHVRKLIAIVYMDMAGYSRLVGFDDIGTIEQIRTLRQELIDATIQENGGKIIQTGGDSLLISFDSIEGAINFAVKTQQEVPRYDGRHLLGQCVRFRMGIGIGDAIAVDTDLHGNAVNVAARLQAECPEGGICVSRAVRDHARDRPDLIFDELGALRLKNIARPVEAFLLRVGLPLDPADQNQSGKDTSHLADAAPPWRGWAWRVLMLLGGVGLLLLSLWPISNWRDTPHQQAERLVRQGLAIRCQEHPCPREWLAKRALFEEAIRIDPTFAQAYAEATFTYTNFVTSHLSVDRNGDLRTAARLATQAVALAPDKAYAHQARAAVLRQDPDKLEDALSAYLRALAIDPNLLTAQANAGWMLVLLGRPAEGKPYLQAALAMAPDHLDAAAWLNYLGIAELFLGRYGSAVDLFRRSIARQPQDAIAADIKLERELNLASALALDGQIDAARAVIERLHRQHPPLSTHNLFWNCDCSHAPEFLTGLATLRRGAALAGVLDTD